MSQSNQSNEYNRLFEKYNKMSNEELSEIAKHESVYTELEEKQKNTPLYDPTQDPNSMHMLWFIRIWKKASCQIF